MEKERERDGEREVFVYFVVDLYRCLVVFSFFREGDV